VWGSVLYVHTPKISASPSSNSAILPRRFFSALIGSIGYGFYCRSVRLSRLLHFSIIAAIVSNAVYWQLNSLSSAYVVSVIAAPPYMTGTLIQLDLTARIIPARAPQRCSLPSWRSPILPAAHPRRSAGGFRGG
jgi:hypothetical protein